MPNVQSGGTLVSQSHILSHIFIVPRSPVQHRYGTLLMCVFSFRSMIVTMSHRLNAAEQRELEDLVQQITTVRAKILYLAVSEKLSLRQKIEMWQLQAQKKKLIRKLTPLMDTFTIIPPYILNLL